MTNSRTLVNLVTVIIASVVLVLFAVTQLLATAILDNTYPLFVELPQAGGLLENKQVTYRGMAIGEIVEVTLCGDDTVVDVPDCRDEEGVLVRMGIDDGVQVPQGVDVVVLRQSAVGEQALDFRPYVATGPATTYYGEREMVVPASIVLPTKPQDLLEVANRVFAPIDRDDAATVISELADAVEGRSEDLQSILVDSASLSESVADNGADYDRFFRASRIVNGSLADNRDALASLITDLADGAQLIGDIRGEIDGLLDTAPPVLAVTTNLLERSDANLSCVVRDLGNLNAFINIPENYANLEEGIRVNDFFFDAFRIIGPISPQGDPWLRVQFIAEPEPPAQRYVPARPVPATLPGGACESVFGPGAGSAVQPSHQLVVPADGEVIRPPNDRQRSATVFAASAAAPVGMAGGDVVAVQPTAPLIADGGASSSSVVGLVVALGISVLLLAVRMVRRRADAVHRAHTAAARGRRG